MSEKRGRSLMQCIYCIDRDKDILKFYQLIYYRNDSSTWQSEENSKYQNSKLIIKKIVGK